MLSLELTNLALLFLFLIVVLEVSIWILRNLAGKTFHLEMLMYGKEPSRKEMAH